MKKGTYEDQIRIEELEGYAHHGVYPEENEKGQHFYVNATLYTNTRPAGLADDLSLSTNYGEVCQFITEFMQQHTFQLIETVAERTAYEVLQHFPLVQGLDLEIRKPEAPIPLPFGSVSVAIHREWHEAYIGFQYGRQQRAYRAGFGTASEEQRHQSGKGVGAVGDTTLWRRRAG